MNNNNVTTNEIDINNFIPFVRLVPTITLSVIMHLFSLVALSKQRIISDRDLLTSWRELATEKGSYTTTQWQHTMSATLHPHDITKICNTPSLHNTISPTINPATLTNRATDTPGQVSWVFMGIVKLEADESIAKPTTLGSGLCCVIV